MILSEWPSWLQEQSLKIAERSLGGRWLKGSLPTGREINPKSPGMLANQPSCTVGKRGLPQRFVGVTSAVCFDDNGKVI